MADTDETAGMAPKPPSGVDAAARLRNRYIIALGLIACLAIMSQVVIQRALMAQESDAPVINIAGRQRMLSQKLAKTALAVDAFMSREHEDLAGFWPIPVSW